ncbi:MAG: TIGR04255 family protein [bacterium]
MAINEVFPKPTVKQVIFGIRFPNLFYMENKIGSLQEKIMKQFPKSALVYRRQIVIADMGPKVKIEDIKDLDKGLGRKLWQFDSDKGFKLEILNDSLSIVSEHHKTYALEGDKFRDTIEFVMSRFLEVVSIPIFSHIGLRYIDECPIISKDNSTFTSYYNSIFPIERFNLADVSELDFKTVIKKGTYYLRYKEILKNTGTEYKLILDFDGFAKDIIPENYLGVTDELHTIISDEYEKTIKEPVYTYMRRVEG